MDPYPDQAHRGRSFHIATTLYLSIENGIPVPAYHGMLWIGDHLGLGWENRLGRSGIWGNRSLRGRPILGSVWIRTHPYGPESTLAHPPDAYGFIRRGLGMSGFCWAFSEMFGRPFGVFDKFGLVPTGPGRDVVWPEPTRIEAYGSIRTPPGPFWVHI